MGKGATDVMAVPVITSLFATFLAFRCNTARDHVALVRDGPLPNVLGKINAKHHSPVYASAAQLAVMIAFEFQSAVQRGRLRWQARASSDLFPPDWRYISGATRATLRGARLRG